MNTLSLLLIVFAPLVIIYFYACFLAVRLLFLKLLDLEEKLFWGMTLVLMPVFGLFLFLLHVSKKTNSYETGMKE